MIDINQGIRELVSEVVRDELRKLVAGPPDEYLSTTSAAKIAGVTMGTVRRWIKSGRLIEHHAGRVLRVSRADLEKLMRSTPTRVDNSTPEQLARKRYG